MNFDNITILCIIAQERSITGANMYTVKMIRTKLLFKNKHLGELNNACTPHCRPA